jgi:hypothetical protein
LKKKNQVELTDNGLNTYLAIPIQLCTSDIGTEIPAIEKLDKDTELKKKRTIISRFRIKSERIHT